MEPGRRARTVRGLLLLAAAQLLAQAHADCTWITTFPQLQRPDAPDEDFSGVAWGTRPLLPAPARDDLCLAQYQGTTQVVHIEEEIPEPVIIARLNYHQAAPAPYIGLFLEGRRVLLDPEIRRIPELDDGWYLVINERQDYETAEMQMYAFRVHVDGEAVVPIVVVSVVNIDDNRPVVNVFDACQVPELGEPRPTSCVYEVTDADGAISTEHMTFRIDSDRGDDAVFGIASQLVAGEPRRMLMTLVLNAPLNFELNPLHIFSVTALDSLPNTHTVSVMVQVENVEHRPPRWLEIWAVQRFDEKTVQNFSVRAIDGDTGIDRPILYRLNNPNGYPFFSIETLEGGRGGGIFHVSEIDRDELEQEMFNLGIVAYKDGNEELSAEVDVTIIVDDVNDNMPTPLRDVYTITIPEETPLTLNFGDDFGFIDRDLGVHAQYSVWLEDVHPEGAAAAFVVAPTVGYQRQTFVMSTVDHALLDYEVPEFQHIELKFVAQEVSEPTHMGEATIHIHLENWNDELPMFEQALYEARFDETEGAGFYVGTARAHDRDIGDRVVHTLMGNANDFLTIDEETGEIRVLNDNSFDYHRQNELFVQVRADDTLMEPYHTTTTQLLIQLNDINNTPPTLRLPRTGPRVQENEPAGHLVTDGITASDPDTTAHLQFSIDWEQSYATKQGRDADVQEYHGCVEIETVFEGEWRGAASGRLVVREIRPGITIDYEMFDMLYLVVRVRDLNTVLNEDSDELTLAVMIVDMNDNAPEWVDGTLDGPFWVREMAAADVVIGSVLAVDIDGPLYNQVRYTIRPRDSTPEDLVKIDFYTGQMSVNIGGAIDADEPRWHLYYTVVASDCCYAEDPDDCPPDPTCYDTPGEVAIEILDTNNQVPEVGEIAAEVQIYENAPNGTAVMLLEASDRDRDEIYHRLTYAINYVQNPRLEAFFAVEPDSGQVYVHYTSTEVLDRDRGEDTHLMFFTITDNFLREGDGNRNPTEARLLVRLLDENDNAPELPPRGDLAWTLTENMQQGVRLQPDIYAPDIDEPDTDNSRVGYGIEALTLLDRDLVPPDLFVMIDIDNKTGELETAMALRGYWGSYDIHIWACDYGVPQMCSDEVYELEVRPYNFHAPQFTFPTDGTLARAARERANPNGPLSLVSGEFLTRVAATDPDGLHAGRVAFEVIGDDGAEQYFSVADDGENMGTLLLTRTITQDDTEFQVRIRATDGGTEPGPLATDVVLTVIFVATIADPVFQQSTASVAIFEYENGLEERHQLPLADDPKNYRCTDDCVDVYYHIIEGNDEGFFSLDARSNVLSLARALNRSEAATHALTVAATNAAQPPASAGAGVPAAARLALAVTVREAEPRPRFVRQVYHAGISAGDSIGRELLTLQAYHSEGATVTYSVDWDSMTAHESLAGVARGAFALAPLSGLLTLAVQPTASMHGMFEFDAVATDPAGATDRAEVKVYVVSSLNRVVFIFMNELTHVEQHVDFIADTFTAGFNMTCNVDQVVPHADGDGVPHDGMTEVRAHFIQDDVPVTADVIEQLRSDAILLRSIQSRLLLMDLELWDFLTELSPEAEADARIALLYFLAALSALLLLLCLLLALLYCVRTRRLNRRLEALSTTKFGSMDSGLNRVGVAVPGTNKHAIEGSNPIWNEKIKAPDFDAISEDSGDSDLIGVEELPQFSRDYRPPPGDLHYGAPFQAEDVANHNNDFGYKYRPF